jgi:DNA-binding CsgD family transcriptional regulator
VLGRRFDWNLLPGVAAVDGGTAVDALRAAIRDQLVVTDGSTFRFRHALTREAVLAEQLPPERAAMSARALVAIRWAHPGLPGPWCELAAELAEAAGERADAAVLLVESARRALARGALISAEATARRAREFARAADADVANDADEVLVRVLAAAGKPGPARQIGVRLLDRLAVGPGSRRADLSLELARAAIAVGDYRAAADDVGRARRALGEAPDIRIAARVDAVAAHVALEQEAMDDAERLAAAAAAAAREAALPEIECEALEVLGRVARMRDLARGLEYFARAARLAERHGLALWLLRARQELALQSVWTGPLEPLRQLRTLAAEVGALVTVAQMDLLHADIAFSRLQQDECRSAAQSCVELSRRLGLASLPVALLWLAGAHALANHEGEMEAVLAEANRVAPEDPRILADAWGRVRAVRCLVQEDRAGARRALDKSMAYVRAAPASRSIFPGRLLWACLHTLDDDDFGERARAEVRSSHLTRTPLRPALDILDAVAMGRQGREAEATALASGVIGQVEVFGGQAMLLLRLVAEGAVHDRWGEPVAWLRIAEGFFAARGYDKVARACRALLKEAGAPAPRRGRGDSAVPAELRALGVTSREMDVLKLIAKGLPNREIAERLYLSPRTVEHHVASLLRRTGAPSRAALAAVVSHPAK